MSDRILVQRIAVFAYHGVHAAEAELGQRFYISVDCALDLSEAGRSDDLASTVSYAAITEVVTTIATSRRFQLIEALAETIAGEILSGFPLLQEIMVRVEKPGAPIPAVLDGVAVEIRRRRNA